MGSPTNLVDMINTSWGRLLVVSRAGVDREGKAVWSCICSCGATLSVRGKSLRSGNTKSCGCLQRDKASARAATGITTTHGASRRGEAHSTYEVWRSMVTRCGNPRHEAYPLYGGRGVTVCPQWLGATGFATFLADVGFQPFGMTLDRRENNGGYCPENVRWASWHTQSRNRRSNRVITFGGASRVVSDWATELGVHLSTLRYRIAHWGTERALSSKQTPKGEANA